MFFRCGFLLTPQLLVRLSDATLVGPDGGSSNVSMTRDVGKLPVDDVSYSRQRVQCFYKYIACVHVSNLVLYCCINLYIVDIIYINMVKTFGSGEK